MTFGILWTNILGMTFADQIQAIIDRTGWTQKRLSAEVGASPPMVSRWVSGQNLPSRANEQRLSEIGRSLGLNAGPTTFERLGVPTHQIGQRASERTALIHFEWCGQLTPSAAAKVASIIADDMADRAFRWKPVEASS